MIELKMSIVFVTGNKHKYQEVQSVLKNYDIIMENIDLPEIQGTDDEITKHKMEYAKIFVKGKFMVEDSSLEYNALNGMPGVYVKWFLNSIGNNGLVKLLDGYENKSASAICNIGYYDGNDNHIFRGVAKGKIVPSNGTSLFGWDNIFMPDGFDQTYGQMDRELKNSISHRRIALDKLNNHLSNN